MAFIENPPGAEILHDIMLEQYKNTATLAELVKQLGDEADVLQDVNRELYVLLDPDAVDGVNLDVLGRIVECLRNGDSDAAYRPRIKSSLSDKNSGTPEQIMAAIKTITGSTTVEYYPEYPAGYWIYATNQDLVTQDILDRLSPAGVQGFPMCILAMTTGELIKTTDTDENVLLVGPCPSIDFPLDMVWDGGSGPLAGAVAFTEPWPFRTSDGIGEQPDGGTGPIDAYEFTFTDGTFAEDTGGA